MVLIDTSSGHVWYLKDRIFAVIQLAFFLTKSNAFERHFNVLMYIHDLFIDKCGCLYRHLTVCTCILQIVFYCIVTSYYS